jgi:nitrous oxide reductase
MRSEKKESANLDRRRLLKGAGLVIGAAGASTAVGAKGAVAASDEAKPQQAGYRETEEVKTYYRLARF